MPPGNDSCIGIAPWLLDTSWAAPVLKYGHLLCILEHERKRDWQDGRLRFAGM